MAEPVACGGIFCDDYAAPVIEENILSGCGLDGIACSNANPWIRGNTITDHAGSGIDSSSTALITNNYIARNQDRGIWLWFGSSATVLGNTIVENHAAGDGGGVQCEHAGFVTIINNILANNTSDGWGGGIHCAASSLSFMNNTLVENSARVGGGIAFSNNCYYQAISNSIFWENDGDPGPEISVGSNTTLAIGYSDVMGGQASVFVDPGGALIWEQGMVDSDPALVDAGHGDFHLTFTSPCRDAGKAVPHVLPEKDFEGDPRIAFGGVDMGADEFHTHLYYTGDMNPGGTVEAKFVGLPGADPVGLWLGADLLDPPWPSVFGWWYLAPPWRLIGPLGSVPPTGVLVIPATLPDLPAGPYELYTQALVGDALTNPGVLKVRPE
jgi:parallel beta-helix repeat protein